MVRPCICGEIIFVIFIMLKCYILSRDGVAFFQKQPLVPASLPTLVAAIFVGLPVTAMLVRSLLLMVSYTVIMVSWFLYTLTYIRERGPETAAIFECFHAFIMTCLGCNLIIFYRSLSKRQLDDCQLTKV
ncbi:hypothetical protein HDE_01110 [Halotydeus destructor]|nr:hypothetical protein HDE_01110 [Halotydeus destructor]